MIEQLCEDVPVDTDAMLRANLSYVARYLDLGAAAESSGEY